MQNIHPAFIDNLIILVLFFGLICFVLCMVALVFGLCVRALNRHQHRKTWYTDTIKQTIDEIKIYPKGAIR